MQYDKMPREIEDLCPPSGSIQQTLKNTRNLKRFANLFGLTLLSQQVIAIISSVAAAVVWYFVEIVLMRRSFSSIGTGFLSDSNSAFSNLMMCFVYVTYMLIPFLIMVFYLKENPFKIVPVKRVRNKLILLPAVCVVLVSSALAGYVTEYIQMFLGFLGLQATSPDFTTPGNLPAFVTYAFEICILAPLCEEFVFRGAILHSLRRFGNAFAVLISALLFSMVHGNLLQMPLAFIVGIVFGVLVIEFKSIWVTVIMHFAVNSISVAVDALSKFYDVQTANIAYFSLILFCVIVTVSVFISVRKTVDIKGKIAEYRRSLLPVPFMVKRFFLTPGVILFTILTVGLVAYYIRQV